MTNETKTVEVSLSRAHKVAEGVKTLMNTHAENVKPLLVGVTVEGFAGDRHYVNLEQLRARGLFCLERYLELSDVLAAIRQEFGRGNAACGVNDRLAEQESLNRKIALLSKVIAVNERAIDLEALPQYCTLQERSGYSANASVTINLLTNALATKYADKYEKLRGAAFRMTDTISDANARRVKLTLPAELAEELGV